MKHAIPHHVVLAGLTFCLAQSLAIAQWSSPGEFSDVKIQPSGTGQAQPFTLSRVAPNVNVPVLNNTGLEIKNPLGGIYLSLPAANGQPSTGGTFGVFKGAESMLYLQPGTSTNTLSIVANTSITGSLTVNGAVSFSGAGNFNIGSGTGAITVTGNNTGVSATGSNAVAIGGSNGLASGEQSVVIGGGSQYGTNTAAGKNSMIIGSGQSVANSESSSVIGANGGEILGAGTQSQYSAIVGGSGNRMLAAAGKYNVILGGGNNTFASGGQQSAIIAGGSNQIDGGGYGQAIIGGGSNILNNSAYSSVVGGSGNWIKSHSSGAGSNFIGGGDQNVIQPETQRSVILGGAQNSVTGMSHTILSAANSSINGGNYNTVMGQWGKASGNYQLVIGIANVEDSTKLFIVGNGTGNDNRSNAFTVDTAGNATAKTSVTTPQLILTTPPDTSDISMGPFTQGAP